MVAAVVEVVLGASGLVGVLLRFIGPLSICPTVSLLGLSLFKSAAGFAGKQWWIAIVWVFMVGTWHSFDSTQASANQILASLASSAFSLNNYAQMFSLHTWIMTLTPYSTIVLIILFSQYLGNLNIPCASYSKEKGLHSKGYPLFRMFPVSLPSLL